VEAFSVINFLVHIFMSTSLAALRFCLELSLEVMVEGSTICKMFVMGNICIEFNISW
jgi:hypothetical protein